MTYKGKLTARTDDLRRAVAKADEMGLDVIQLVGEDNPIGTVLKVQPLDDRMRPKGDPVDVSDYGSW